jgi:hypothetical protein
MPFTGCQCGAGAPCPICNALIDELLPALGTGFQATLTRDANYTEGPSMDLTKALARIIKRARRTTY